MRSLSKICASLAGFFLVAAIVYGLSSHEPIGATMLTVTCLTFLFLAAVTRSVARREEPSPGQEPLAAEPVHVGPTLSPFGFAISAIGVALSITVTPWMLIPAGILFAASAAVWLREVGRSHAHDPHR